MLRVLVDADNVAGPVLVVSGAASGRLRDNTVVVDPALEGVEPIRQWLKANGISAEESTPTDR